MKLIKKWDEFYEELNSFIVEGNLLSQKDKTITTNSELESVKDELSDFVNRCFSFLNSSFDIPNNEFANEFKNAHLNSGQKTDFSWMLKDTFEGFNAKKNKLPYILKLLSVSDAIIKPEMVELSNRENYTTNEILELILEKLYDLYDNDYYPISRILKGNGIEIKRYDEDRDLAKTLKDYGYIRDVYTIDVRAQLTLKGKIHIEEKRKVYKENYTDINGSPKEINDRIDEIIERLIKLGYGQEIIFDEIQELKELYTTLNKKNWGQVIKGKLVDLALAKLIENDTLNYIYEKLTDHTLRLP